MNNVLEMLEQSAVSYPEKAAFTDPGKSISFSALEDTAKKVGTLLCRGEISEPVKPEHAVAFFMEKSVDAACVMFGAVYAGAFTSFIDVRQTDDRIRAILSVLQPVLIVTDTEHEDQIKKAEALPEGSKIVRIDVLLQKAENTEVSGELLKKVREEAVDTAPLYVNFTSGSTGVPKGVAVGHASVIDFISVFTKTFGIGHEDILANQAPFDFDVSIKDIYSGLYTGAEVVLIPRDYFTNPSKLMDYLSEHRITILIWAVSAMCFVSIMNGLEYKCPQTIRTVMFSGELMPVKQLNKWKKSLPDVTYVNLYGPTEITCNCSYYILDREFEKDELIPVGIPFENEKVFLLDEEDRLVTGEGKEGEICVGGRCLALGYYREREKTDEVFVQNPLNDRYPERIYRTGDIGKYDKDHNLIFTSRKDHQIKHMGQRIELGDIEVSAMSGEGVERACCLYDEKRKKIVLFYTGEAEKEELSSFLHEKLPPFMIPGKTIRLSAFPMNKNGKIDRNALKEEMAHG